MEEQRSAVSRESARMGSRVAAYLAVLAFAGCATPAYRPAPPQGPLRVPIPAAPAAVWGDEIALRAMAQVGIPYRYGGADVDGFDCSGLVYYIHQDLGVAVPRTAAAQHAAASPVGRGALLPGDLVFFRTDGRRISHVGIYAGEGRFVHAPQPGRAVEIRSLDDGYYERHYAGGGRLAVR